MHDLAEEESAMDGPIRFLIIIAVEDSDGISTNGVWIQQIAPPYYLFKEVPAEVALATPSGGFQALLGQTRHGPSNREPFVQRFLSDREARDDLADTLSLEQIVADDFDAAFCIGFSGSVWGTHSRGPGPLIKTFLEDGKPVAIIPGQQLDIAPEAAGPGLLIIGDSDQSPVLAAHALVKVATERREHMARSA
ncbi:transporter [Sinorhizobium meliloti]|uniref:transporter n=2 Tax=Rhizobium meliloti TaxID=382 RepID=UPI001F17E047|nr:transporter [Sinorhizobium meliloti]